ncbi:ribosome biogenesis GTPase Der [Marinicauda algicola]|uniref:GTPase Der n=1 Tax=Marinicauda algicola TaxID=2029849 RepID=A0A4S2GXV9_9PROT|nr:ribosome biogenesis GTPase Der [Marinicauda algicola]TGY87975.1 ribosome biogenesis GTPase Der [Marinicauda algicola]
MTRPPTIAVVGRPNVGKSTLFNRLAGKPLAIVDDRPGVTRDRREARGRLGDLDLRLIDTAGYEDAKDGIEARMRAQTEAALKHADVCIFLIDGREGVTALDERFAALLRKSDRPVILAVNKCEGKQGDAGALEAWNLGLGEPVPISAAHGEGMADLYRAVLDALEDAGIAGEGPGEDLVLDDEDPNLDEEEDDNPPLRIAVVGRPNVGKSTLVNALIGEERLITGPEAGLTRDAIAVEWEWNGRRVRLHDTAGLRKRGKVEDRLERMSAADTLRAIKFAEVVLLLVDAERPFEKQDLTIASRVADEGRGLIVLLSKWDTVTDKQKTLQVMREEFERLLPQVKGAPLLPVSGLTGRGLDQIMPAVDQLHRNWRAKVKTRDLNDWLKEMTQRHPPPAVDGRRVKPRYMAQTKGRPPTFVLMCSRAAHMPDSYKRYLINGLREAFDLPGVPIRLIVKGGKNPYAKD